LFSGLLTWNVLSAERFSARNWMYPQMAEQSAVTLSEQEFLERTADRVRGVFDAVAGDLRLGKEGDRLATLRQQYSPGKMLRSRLAWQLFAGGPASELDTLVRGAAAIELIHTATLFHDDVIDGASMRRNQPTLWREVGQTGAILLGDLCYTCAIQLLLETERLDLAQVFVAKVRECCTYEVCHELLYREQEASEDMALRLARGKTGALFAFIGYLAGQDAAQRAAFEEAGYLVGTAYQLGDDLLDEIGDEASVGKTLGTDRQRHKFTLAQRQADGERVIRLRLRDLCQQAQDHCAPWPAAAEHLGRYLKDTLLPQFAANAARVA
jgi:heptaprenyl diphosphate synthase